MSRVLQTLISASFFFVKISLENEAYFFKYFEQYKIINKLINKITIKAPATGGTVVTTSGNLGGMGMFFILSDFVFIKSKNIHID